MVLVFVWTCICYFVGTKSLHDDLNKYWTMVKVWVWVRWHYGIRHSIINLHQYTSADIANKDNNN